MVYDFECKLKGTKHIPFACGLFIKTEVDNTLENFDDYYKEEGVVDWFVNKIDSYNKLFKDIFIINIPLKDVTVTQLTSNCYYCNDELGSNCVRDHDHLNGVFRGYAHNKCNLQAKNIFESFYA